MAVETANAISLKVYAVNNILYQRGIYPEASFKANKKYDLSVLVTTDEKLTEYINTILNQIRSWLEMGAVRKLVLIIKSTKVEEVLERWQFDLTTEIPDCNSSGKKSLSQIQEEIRNVIRQIVACNTFLPVLTSSCTFELLVYTDRNANIPDGWSETGPHFITNSAEIKLRSISTTIHRVDHMISYKRS